MDGGPDAGALIEAAAGPGDEAIAGEQTHEVDQSLAAHPRQGGYAAQTSRALGGVPAAFLWFFGLDLLGIAVTGLLQRSPEQSGWRPLLQEFPCRVGSVDGLPAVARHRAGAEARRHARRRRSHDRAGDHEAWPDRLTPATRRGRTRRTRSPTRCSPTSAITTRPTRVLHLRSPVRAHHRALVERRHVHEAPGFDDP